MLLEANQSPVLRFRSAPFHLAPVHLPLKEVCHGTNVQAACCQLPARSASCLNLEGLGAYDESQTPLLLGIEVFGPIQAQFMDLVTMPEQDETLWTTNQLQVFGVYYRI